jgi:DNA-directed RNA polymerase specialized sigma24 family protein
MDDRPDAQTRLDEITTQWSLLRRAHQGPAGAARNTLALRYAGAIRGYVGALLQDSQDADELSQEVLVRILHGDFAGATPERGRFRDLLKVAVRNMVRTWWGRKQRRASVPLDLGQVPAPEGDELPGEAEWVSTWQKNVLKMTWDAMESYEFSHPGTIAWTLLRLRADHTDDDLGRLASRLQAATGRAFRPAALRQQLRRSRLRFAQLLIEELARGLDDPTPERVEVGLMEYVRDFLPPDWRTRGELREQE